METGIEIKILWVLVKILHASAAAPLVRSGPHTRTAAQIVASKYERCKMSLLAPLSLLGPGHGRNYCRGLRSVPFLLSLVELLTALRP